MIRARAGLVRARTALVNMARGLAKSYGQRLRDCNVRNMNPEKAQGLSRELQTAPDFIYTSCALPKFCFRNSNTFGVLQKRFKEKMGRELVLLTVTFDPQRDGPDVLAKYAKTWKADPATWHFLTGSGPDIQHVSNMFGMDYFPDEGLMNHSLHTAIIDRKGRLVANIEGNQFTADQLGDLVQSTLSRRSDRERRSQAHFAHNEGLGPLSNR